jgi:non-specific serine/threonine protein kinase
MASTRASVFGDLLRSFRLDAGLTQEQLAERAGLSVRGISDIERGLKARPHRETRLLLADALHLASDKSELLESAGRDLAVSPAPMGSVGPRPATRHNLPVQRTSFVGREREIAEVKERLLTTRLLTLTGSPGCGKTRLSLAIANPIRTEYLAGVWLVELAQLTDPRLVPDAVAAAIGCRVVTGQPIVDVLREALRTKRLLLLLDNCEHVLDACARLTDQLLRSCPELRILTTSREALGIPGEVIWRVPPLPLPPLEGSLTSEGIAAFDATRLFVERARAVRPDFEPTARQWAAIAQICRQLDGIPLAIELAAARLGAFSPEQIAGRLDQRFGLLTGGSRAAPPRQQTLRASIAWSDDLLSESERVLFRRLARFSGSFSLEEAEAVYLDVLEVLMLLADKSLIEAESTGDGVRFRLLETVRAYGEEQLREADDAARMHRVYPEPYRRMSNAIFDRARGGLLAHP